MMQAPSPRWCCLHNHPAGRRADGPRGPQWLVPLTVVAIRAEASPRLRSTTQRRLADKARLEIPATGSINSSSGWQRWNGANHQIRPPETLAECGSPHPVPSRCSPAPVRPARPSRIRPPRLRPPRPDSAPFTPYQISRTIPPTAAMTNGPSRSPNQPNTTSNNSTELDNLYAAGSQADSAANRSYTVICVCSPPPIYSAVVLTARTHRTHDEAPARREPRSGTPPTSHRRPGPGIGRAKAPTGALGG
jgi:hypothetical protein